MKVALSYLGHGTRWLTLSENADLTGETVNEVAYVVYVRE
jgi:hypothetical protein